MVNCTHCNGHHVIYECPQLSNMNAEQQRSHFRQPEMSDNQRSQRSAAVRQLSTHIEYECEDQDPVYNALDYNNDMTEQDWLDFQCYCTDFHRGNY